ncbi:hypothetical protein B7494_g2579 [Chlorociboria aeruginascens]|nr:hypothetical protein B7494_g2579 [Chlorociboria aeruginascens]
MTGATSKARWHFLPLTIKTILLISIYSAYGLLQERIIKGNYTAIDGSETDDTFRSAPFLVLCNRLTSLVTGLLLSQITSINSKSSLLPDNSSGRQQTWIETLLARVRPASPFIYYAAVAGLNNAATLSQYSSLSYLSFTTSTLGKSAKMVPVLIIGHLWYNKRYKVRQWIGAFLVILGIWGYLTSLPRSEEIKVTTNWIGVLCLLAYLLFDGLTSTMQEKLFGQAKNQDAAPSLMGITGGIVDQMIWVNLFSSIIALSMLFLSPSSTTIPSIQLALTSPTLQLHILVLSLTATTGLLVLFHVIAAYGALVAGLIMTIRQFVSIVCNAAWFGNLTSIPQIGWAGIGFMAAGIWIKMDRRYDGKTDKNNMSRLITLISQYLGPSVACPVTFVVLITMIEFTKPPETENIDAFWKIP